MRIQVRELAKSFEAMDGVVQALRGLSFEVKRGEFYTLLGPSGCGKSTTLRCIAGLERPDSGEIVIGDQVVVSGNAFVPPNERPIGMVFQSYAIWPHMTVFKNVAFPLKQGKPALSKAELRERVMAALALVKMEELVDRPAPYLSGGQQQRVALARALVCKPQVLLLDEPLSNLDAKLREELRVELKELVQRVGITTLYVTHDQVEALAMSDRIAVMLSGAILQEAGPKDLYLTPNSKFVAQFIGQVNFFSGKIAQHSDDAWGVVETSQGQLRCRLPAGIQKGATVLVTVRPESLHVAQNGEPRDGNMLEGKVEKTIFLGEFIDCQLLVGSQLIRAKLAPTSDVGPGDRLCLRFNPQACVVLPITAAE
jgi:iron(III) transport system ATP-binding protein